MQLLNKNIVNISGMCYNITHALIALATQAGVCDMHVEEV